MSDEQTTSTETEENRSTEERDHSGLPKWARNSISEANNEAAKFRTQLREKTEEHTQALSQVEELSNGKSKAESERDSAQLELKKLLTVLEAGVPGGQATSIASRLQGSTDDELKEDAQKLVQQFGLNRPQQRAVDPSQARGGEHREKPSTPESAFAQQFSELLRGR